MKMNRVLALVAITTVASASAALADDASDKAAVAKQIGSGSRLL
jgi:hypothetical protein